MRVLLIISTAHLEAALSNLNPEMDICALVTDELQPSAEIMAKHNRAGVPLFPFYRLKECIDSFYFDKVIFTSNLVPPKIDIHYRITDELLQYNIPIEKIIGLFDWNQACRYNTIAKLFNHYEKNVEHYKMFMVGMSYEYHALNINQFDLPTIKFASSSQDFYYDNKIMSRLLTGGRHCFKYALIGVIPFIFNWDVSKSRREIRKLTPYFLYFRDLHNFYMSVEEYEKLFSKEFIDGGYMNDEAIDLNDPYSELTDHEMDINDHLDVKYYANTWKGRHHAAVIAENKKILDDCLTLCETNNVKPIMVMSPASVGYKEMYPKDSLDEFYTLLNDVMKKHSTAVFFNGWELEGFEDTHLFWDSTHMNRKGAAKFTPILNDFIMQFERK